MTIKRSQACVKAMLDKQDAIAVIGTDIALNDNGASADTITQVAAGFLTAGFRQGQKVHIIGSASNDAITAAIVSVVAGTITFATGTLAATEAAGSSICIFAPDGGSWADMFNGAQITYFNGTQPASADDSKGGATAIYEFENVQVSGAAYDAVNDWYEITLTASISANALADGTVTWFRCVRDNDNRDDASTTDIRFDGSIGVSGDIILASTTVSLGDPDTLTTLEIRVAQ